MFIGLLFSPSPQSQCFIPVYFGVAAISPAYSFNVIKCWQILLMISFFMPYNYIYIYICVCVSTLWPRHLSLYIELYQ